MALTKVNFIIGMLAIVLIFGSLVIIIGNDLIQRGVPLDTKSKSYINNETQYFNLYNYSQYNESKSAEIKSSDILADNDTKKLSGTDVLASINYWRSIISKITGFFKLVYDFPSFMLISFGLNLVQFKAYINIITWILFVGLIIIFIRLARGS